MVSEDNMLELCLLVLCGPQDQAWWQDCSLLSCLAGPRLSISKLLCKEQCRDHSLVTGGEGAGVLEAGPFPTAPRFAWHEEMEFWLKREKTEGAPEKSLSEAQG